MEASLWNLDELNLQKRVFISIIPILLHANLVWEYTLPHIRIYLLYISK